MASNVTEDEMEKVEEEVKEMNEENALPHVLQAASEGKDEGNECQGHSQPKTGASSVISKDAPESKQEASATNSQSESEDKHSPRKCERLEDDGSKLEQPEDVSHNANAGKSEESTGTASARQHDGSENNAERNDDNQDSSVFPHLRRVRPRHRRYRRHLSPSSSSSSSTSSDSTVRSLSSSNEELQNAASSSSPVMHPDDSDSTDDSSIGNRILDVLNRQVAASALALDSDDTWSLLDSDDSDSNGEAGNRRDSEKEDFSEMNKKYHKCLSKENPKHKWFVTKAVMNRQLGMQTRQQAPELFRQHCYGSLHCVKRLELMYKLDEHRGCVNAISFNQSGTRLASGSDDKKIIVWNWSIGKSIATYSSGHSSNVFQAKFLPLSGDNHIVSSARDGQVRLAVLSSSGECRGTRRLANHRKPVNKLSLLPETPHVFLSAGEDGRVMAIDIRSKQQSTIVTVNDDRRKIGLYSVDTHPLNNDEFCVCGVDYYIRIYDKRKIDLSGEPMKKFCPHHIVGTNKYTNVTCALYNHDGTEIIGSYNDENLYLFDSRHSDGADFVHKYEGHRNSATVKSCEFYGPNSEYIISGSDCGNIFFWDKNTEAIVQFMRGDEKGVVNALVGHPQYPILATSGLDSDVKIWVPSCEQDTELKELRKVVTKNLRDRENDQPFRADVFESHFNMDGIRQFAVNLSGLPVRLRARFTDDGSSSDGSDSDGYAGAQSIQCPQS